MSDVVGDDYKTWQPGEIIGLSGGTGTGKTKLVLGVIAREAQEQGKTVLYLCNRTSLKEEVERDVCQQYGLTEDTIKVITYQKLQSALEKRRGIRQYDYLFCDECHYFFTDAVFNPATDKSYEYVMTRKDAVVILMSATASKLFNYLIAEGKMDSSHLYYIPQDYSYVDEVIVYDPGAFFQLVDNILAKDEDSKVICFVNGKRMYMAYEYYGDKAYYMCSVYAKDEKLRRICGLPKLEDSSTGNVASRDKKVMEDSIIKKYSNEMITFDKRLLFTTRTMENGVTLKDQRIRAIFTELSDPDAMIQSLGRKRPLPDCDDVCTFYIKRFQTNWMVGKANQIRKWVSEARNYLNNPEFSRKVYFVPSKSDELRKNDIFRTDEHGVIAVNMMRYRKYEMDVQMYDRIYEIGYDAALQEILGETLALKIHDDDTIPMDVDPLKEFLETLRGKRLYKAEQDEIKARFKEFGLNLGKVLLKGKRSPGISALNGVLDTRYGDTYKPRFINKDPETGRYFREKKRKTDEKTGETHRNDRYWLFVE